MTKGILVSVMLLILVSLSAAQIKKMNTQSLDNPAPVASLCQSHANLVPGELPSQLVLDIGLERSVPMNIAATSTCSTAEAACISACFQEVVPSKVASCENVCKEQFNLCEEGK